MTKTDVGQHAIDAAAFLENLSELVFQTDTAGRWTFLNAAWSKLTGHDVAASLGLPFFDFLCPDERERHRLLFDALIRQEEPWCRHELRYLHADGTVRWLEASANPVLSMAGGVVGTAGILVDVTRRKECEAQLRLASSVFTHAGEGVMITAADTTIIDVNGAFEAITGYTREEARGRRPNMLNSGRQPAAFYTAMWERLCAEGFWQGEVWNRHKSGEAYVERLTIVRIGDENGQPLNYVGIFSDITTQTLQAEHLERIAHYDPLTGLPNRCLLTARLQHSMAQACRRGTQVAVVYLDLDGFKAINDCHGHETGDELLLALGARMKAAIRECDTIGRMGGDEFVVVIDDVHDVVGCLPLVRRLAEAVSEPVAIEAHRLHVTASLGIALYSRDEEVDPDQLIRRAAQAMYHAKLQGKDRHVIFGDETLSQGSRAALTDAVERALANDEFELYYQPIVHLQTGELNSVEALIRWNHPQRGLVPPGEFLPLLEGHPLAVRLDDWVLDQALRQHQLWLAEGLDVAISVNTGSAQLQQQDFVERLRARLEANPAIKQGRIKLEVLETSALDDIGHVSRTIAECGKLGVPFALDDFGTGYSSLLYLKQLPAKRIKIDQSFVRDMLVDPEDLAILEGVLGMGAAFKREVVAEGVETIAHARMLVQMGCVLAQGYGIARPMPARQLRQWAAQWRLPADLLGCRILDRHGVQLLVAGVEHQAWIGRLAEHLRDRARPLREAPHEHCRLGAWLRETRFRGDACGGQFELVENLHRDIHAAGKEILVRLDESERSVLETQAANLMRLGQELFAALSGLVQSNRSALPGNPVVALTVATHTPPAGRPPGP